MSEELGPLTAEIVDDDEALEALVDAAFQADPIAQARATEIAEWTAWLRDALDAETYKLFLELERRVEQRWVDLGCVLLRYGFAAGQLPRKSGEVLP